MVEPAGWPGYPDQMTAQNSPVRGHSPASQDIDTRDPALQLRGLERTLAMTVRERDRLREELVKSKGEGEALRMRLAAVRSLLEDPQL